MDDPTTVESAWSSVGRHGSCGGGRREREEGPGNGVQDPHGSALVDHVCCCMKFRSAYGSVFAAQHHLHLTDV